MKSVPKPINIPDDIAARCTGPDQAQRMDALFRKVIAMPHSTVLRDAAKRKLERAILKVPVIPG